MVNFWGLSIEHFPVVARIMAIMNQGEFLISEGIAVLCIV